LDPGFATSIVGNVDLATPVFEGAASLWETGLRKNTLAFAPSQVCAITRRGQDLSALVKTDIDGKPRSATPTIGAMESSAMCP
jgi:hypothetical protein